MGSVPQIFSVERRKARWQRAVARRRAPGAADFVFAAMAEEIDERLGFIRHDAAEALLIGDPTGRANSALQRYTRSLQHVGPTEIDEEAPLSAQFGLIASLCSLDTVNDVPGALVHIREALAPGGIAMIGFLGSGSLPRLRSALLAAEAERPAARMHPLIDVQAGSALMQRAGFARQVADHFTLTARYGSLDRLVGDLRDQALTGVLRSATAPLAKEAAERTREAFLHGADPDGKVAETFEIVMLTGWKD